MFYLHSVLLFCCEYFLSWVIKCSVKHSLHVQKWLQKYLKHFKDLLIKFFTAKSSAGQQNILLQVLVFVSSYLKFMYWIQDCVLKAEVPF